MSFGRFGFGFGLGSKGRRLDPAASAFFARLTNQPTAARKAAYNKLFVDLRNTGILPLLDALYIMAAADSQAATRNLIQDAYNLTPVNSPTFTIDRDYAGNGTSSYLTTGVRPGAVGLQYQQNNAHFSVYDRTTRAGVDAYPIGVYDGTSGSIIVTRSSTNTFQLDVNDGLTSPGAANASNPGMYAAERNNSANIQGYKNGTTTGSFAIASTAPGGVQDFYLLAVNFSGSPTAFIADNVAGASLGAFLGATKQAQLYTAMQTYMTAVGANV